VFAGAAREAVFSRPATIARIREDFVPVALKAGLVNNPPDDAEGRLYEELARSRPAPQGICVADSLGRALVWALSFDDDESIDGFLDHAVALFSKPRAATERYMRFPGRKLEDVPASGAKLPVPDGHGDGVCPAKPRIAAGSVVARVVGRALDDDGVPVDDTRSQAIYAEEVFFVPPQLQASLARALRGETRVRMPDALARLLVSHAYLGQLDVRPLDSPVPGLRPDVEVIELQAWVDGEIVRLQGVSQVRIGERRRSDGAGFRHEVKLEWQGFLRLEGERITDLVIDARGHETLTWGHPRLGRDEGEVAHLMAGSPLDVDTQVRYGITGRQAKPEEVCEAPVRGRRPAPAGRMAGGPSASLRGKLQRLHAEVQRAIREGRTEDAEAALDEALRLLER